MENITNINPINIAHQGEDKILEKVWDYFSIEVSNLLVKHDQSFELDKKWRYGFYVKEKNTWHVFWVFASFKDEKLADLTTTDLDYFEEVTQ
jgi:hypothetical protein